MFHKALSVKFLEGTALIVAFKDGTVKYFDMSALFPKYPQLKALQNRDLFLSGELMGEYGIIWNVGRQKRSRYMHLYRRTENVF